MQKTITEDDHVLFNALRQEHQGKTFKRTDLRRLLVKELKFPAGEAFFIAMVSGSNSPIVQVALGRYKFNDKPVYKDRLQKAFDDYCTRVNGYTEKQKAKRAKNKAVKKEVVTQTTTPEITVEQAIATLKKAGFRVYKPVTQYEEI